MRIQATVLGNGGNSYWSSRMRVGIALAAFALAAASPALPVRRAEAAAPHQYKATRARTATQKIPGYWGQYGEAPRHLVGFFKSRPEAEAEFQRTFVRESRWWRGHTPQTFKTAFVTAVAAVSVPIWAAIFSRWTAIVPAGVFVYGAVTTLRSATPTLGLRALRGEQQALADTIRSSIADMSMEERAYALARLRKLNTSLGGPSAGPTGGAETGACEGWSSDCQYAPRPGAAKPSKDPFAGSRAPLVF